jgi:hypothetical protein
VYRRRPCGLARPADGRSHPQGGRRGRWRTNAASRSHPHARCGARLGGPHKARFPASTAIRTCTHGASTPEPGTASAGSASGTKSTSKPPPGVDVPERMRHGNLDRDQTELDATWYISLPT